MSTVNINTTNNTVSIQDTNQEISVTDNNKNTTVSIPQTNTNIVQVNTPGPQGPVGPQGTGGGGSSINTGSFATTGSNAFNGNQTITGSLIQGLGNIATGENSHAEGDSTQAIGPFSHAEGLGTIAYGGRSHAEGQDTIASGSYSHAEGNQTIALADHQHVQGQYNAISSIPAAFIVGNGTDNDNRSNLIHAAGNEVQITGSLNVTNGITGSLQGSASFAISSSQAISSSRAVSASFASTASYVLNAVSSSFASTASFAPNYLLTSNTSSMLTPYVLTSVTSSFTTTSSFNTFTSSINNKTGSFATTGSNIFIGNQTITGSLIVSSSADPQFIIGNNLLTISSSGQMGISGSIVPNTHNLYSLGTTGVRFSTLFVQDTVNGNTGLFNNINMGSSSPMSIINNTSQTVAQWYGPTANLRLQSGSTPAYVDNGYRLQINSLGAVSGGLYITGSTNQSLIRVDIPGTDGILFVTGSGRVGIGTSTPGARLDVFGTGQIINMGNGTSTDAYIDFAGNRGKFGFESATGIRFQGTNTRPIVFALGNWGTGEIARFSTQGFFGLNTNNPSAWLHISGTVASGLLLRIDAPGSSSIFEVSGSGVVTINGSIPVTRNATGYNVTRFTNSASFDNIRVAISSSGNPVASSVSGSVNVYYNTISSVVGSAISSSVNTGAIFTTGSWSVLTSATLGSGGDTITSHIQDQDRGRLYRATFIQTAGPTSGSVVIERLI